MKGSEQKDLYKQLGDQSIGTISINLAISLVTDVSANPGETVMTVGSPRPLLSFNLSITDQEPELRRPPFFKSWATDRKKDSSLHNVSPVNLALG